MNRKVAMGLVLVMAVLLFPAMLCAGDQPVKETEVLLKGALNQANQFVDENDQAYDLVINEAAAALVNMPRQPIQIKGTFWEHNGKTQLNITSIRPANP
mgnify:CR=1 FL=1